jgi:hypothetical protein
LLLILCGTLQLILCPSTSWAKSENKQTTVISVEAQNEPLKDVFAKVSKASGYDIEVNKDAEDLPVSVIIKNSSVYSAVKQIVAVLKGPGYTMKAEDKKIFVTIVSRVSEQTVQPPPKSNPAPSQSVDPDSIEVVPPTTEGNRAITLKEMQANDSAEQGPRATTEMTPPTEQGGKSIVFADMQAAETEHESDSSSVEVVPPKKTGEKAITLGEVQAMSDIAQEPDISSIEVIPPADADGAGVTLGEIGATLAQSPGGALQDKQKQ